MLELDFIVYNDRTNNKLWYNYVNYIISITNHPKDKSNQIIHNSHYVWILNWWIFFTDFETSWMTLINLHDIESWIDLFDDYYINIKECSHDYANNIKCIFRDLYKEKTYSYDCDYYWYNKKLKRHEVYDDSQINNIKEIWYNTLLSSYIIHSVSNYKVLTLENNTEWLVDFIIEDDWSNDGINVSMKNLKWSSWSNEEQTNLIPNKINMRNEIKNLLITEFISDKNNIKAIKEIKEFIETNVDVLQKTSNVLDRYWRTLRCFGSNFDWSIEDSDIDTIKKLIVEFEYIKEFINNFKLLRIEQVVKEEPKDSFDVQKYFNN